MATFPPFVRRHNRDSTIDSICTKCFQTIASALCEDDLAAPEQTHVCVPLDEFVSWRADPPSRRPARPFKAQSRTASS